MHMRDETAALTTHGGLDRSILGRLPDLHTYYKREAISRASTARAISEETFNQRHCDLTQGTNCMSTTLIAELHSRFCIKQLDCETSL